MSKISLATFFVALLIFVVSGCGKKAVEVSEAVPEPPEIIEDTQEEAPPMVSVRKIDDKAPSPLTGLLIDVADAEMRPFAVMINNLPKALPQSGIANADIYYEALAEGGITRILAVFGQYFDEKIGPVRSARHYYLDFAFDNDAIYVHHGGSPKGYGDISKLDVDNLDGIRLDGTMFKRDPVRVKAAGMYEHSSYTNGVSVYETAEKYGYRVDKLEDFSYMFEFFNVPAEVGERHDSTLEMRFSGEQTSVFTYDEETRLYMRSQNGKPHIDELTGEQLAVSNVIVQYANVYVIQGDPEGRRNIELVSSGDGVLYTGGTSRKITWSKKTHTSPTAWRDENGNAVKLNKGKTWICVMGN